MMRVRPFVFALGAIAGLALLGAAGADSAHAQAQPSFDCEDARGDVLTAICETDELAELDMTLARLFARAMARAPSSGVNELRREQNDWRDTRNECRRASDLEACVAESYRDRIETLEARLN